MNIAGIIPLEQKAQYLRTLPSIRERCGRVHELAKQGKLQYFDYHPEKEQAAVDLCIEVIKVCLSYRWVDSVSCRKTEYVWEGGLHLQGRLHLLADPTPSPTNYLTTRDQIPPHGRWRHLDAGLARVEPVLLSAWSSASPPVSTTEQGRRAIDLFIASVLLDAGAGNAWKYEEKETGQTFARSEGLGVASFRMFESGFFSSKEGAPHQVDGTFPSRLCDLRI